MSPFQNSFEQQHPSQLQKNARELALEAPNPEGNFEVGAYSIGYIREIVKNKRVDVGVGE